MIKRDRDFKIGTFHGKLNPKNLNCEAKLRNELYLIGLLQLNYSMSKTDYIRIIGFEIPLTQGQKRGECIDLLGYDASHNLYIIELKLAASVEKLETVIKQINEYERLLQYSRLDIEREFQTKFHIPNFKFSDQIKKIILAPREYFRAHTKEKSLLNNILLCSFANITNSKDLLAKRTTGAPLALKIENK